MRPLAKVSVVVVAMLAAAGAAYALFGDRIAAEPRYRTAGVQRGSLSAVVSAVGTVNAVKLVQVGAEISGQIRELYADFNSVVRAGQVIALIAPENFRARLDQATAELEMAAGRIRAARVGLARARTELVRMKAQDLVYRARSQGARVVADQAGRDLDRKAAQLQKGFVSPSEYEQAQAARDGALAALAAVEAEQRVHGAVIASAGVDVKAAGVDIQLAEASHRQAAAALRQAEVDLKHTRITAPIDGIVIERNVDVGQTVAASLQAPTVFTIAQSLKGLQVETYVDETDIGRVRIGQPANFSVGAFPGVTFSGRVVQMRKAPLVIQNVVTYLVIISARNESLRLLPGMTATVRIVSERIEDTVLVANAALRFRPPADADRGANGSVAVDGDAAAPGWAGRVYVMAPDGALSVVPLRIGASDGTVTQVIDGALKAGDRVVIGVRRAARRGGRLRRVPRL
jgi:HlyD family secretion protein